MRIHCQSSTIVYMCRFSKLLVWRNCFSKIFSELHDYYFLNLNNSCYLKIAKAISSIKKLVQDFLPKKSVKNFITIKHFVQWIRFNPVSSKCFNGKANHLASSSFWRSSYNTISGTVWRPLPTSTQSKMATSHNFNGPPFRIGLT